MADNSDGESGREPNENEPGGKTAPSSGGEDEASTENEGDDSHLHEDQKSRKLPT